MRPTTWEELIYPFRTVPIAATDSSEGEALRRAHRVGRYEAWLARPVTEILAACPEIAADYQRRCAALRELGRSFTQYEEFYRFRRAAESGHRGTLGAWLLPIAALTAMRMLLSHGRVYRLQRRLARAECPRCGYRLASMGQTLAAARSEREIRMLQACPECGYAWPLLPPDVQGAMRG